MIARQATLLSRHRRFDAINSKEQWTRVLTHSLTRSVKAFEDLMNFKHPPNTIFVTDHTTGYFVNVLPD